MKQGRRGGGLTLSVHRRTKSVFLSRGGLGVKMNKGQHHFPPFPTNTPWRQLLPIQQNLRSPPQLFWPFFLSFWSGLVFHPPYSPLPTTNCIDGRFLLLSVSHFHSLFPFPFPLHHSVLLTTLHGVTYRLFFPFCVRVLDIKLFPLPVLMRTATPLLNWTSTTVFFFYFGFLSFF